MMLSMRRNPPMAAPALTRRGWISLLTAGAASLSALLAVQAQTLETVDYLFPAPAQQIAFAPWIVAQQRGYYAQEGLKL
ncbi:MAG: nitrate transporter substrate-binding protein, partial [Polaromonas sp.]|nr:nitrate transporter substrate-binding protein [Polaromonas sp.]